MSTLDAGPQLDAMRYRPDFPILHQVNPHGAPLAYLDNAATTQRPRQVIDAITEMYERHYANVHRGIHWLSDQSTDQYEVARGKVQSYINAADSSEVIFTRGTTESINLVAHSYGALRVGEGDEILLTEMEHHSNIVPWQQLAERSGARVRFAPITDEGRLDLEALASLINERTRVVALCAVSNVLGTMNPIESIARLAHEAGAVVVVDAAQSVPHHPLDVQVWQADFVAFSGHKMLGPSGIGVLYGRRELLDAMPPFMGGGSMIRRVTLEGFEPADVPAKFEAGTPPIVAAVGLGAAIDYLSQFAPEQILTYERQLAQQAHQILEELGGIRFLGPPPQEKAGIVSFVDAHIHAHDVAQLLDRHGVAVRAGHHCTMPLHKRLGINASSRASFYFYNTPDEVERLGQALAAARSLFRRQRT